MSPVCVCVCVMYVCVRSVCTVYSLHSSTLAEHQNHVAFCYEVNTTPNPEVGAGQTAALRGAAASMIPRRTSGAFKLVPATVCSGGGGSDAPLPTPRCRHRIRVEVHAMVGAGEVQVCLQMFVPSDAALRATYVWTEGLRGGGAGKPPRCRCSPGPFATLRQLHAELAESSDKGGVSGGGLESEIFSPRWPSSVKQSW